jgi:hypothetical protein
LVIEDQHLVGHLLDLQTIARDSLIRPLDQQLRVGLKLRGSSASAAEKPIARVAWGLPTLYFAWRSREFRKFLAGAFFVSAGIQFYLYLAEVSVPLLGTDLVLTPDVSWWRSIPTVVLIALQS